MEEIEMLNVKRVDGKVTDATALIGDLEIHYIRSSKTGKPYRVSRKRYGVQVADEETLRISKAGYKALSKKIEKIFSEERPKKIQERPTL